MFSGFGNILVNPFVPNIGHTEPKSFVEVERSKPAPNVMHALSFLFARLPVFKRKASGCNRADRVFWSGKKLRRTLFVNLVFNGLALGSSADTIRLRIVLDKGFLVFRKHGPQGFFSHTKS